MARRSHNYHTQSRCDQEFLLTNTVFESPKEMAEK